jgi:hypothetical protein
MASRITEIIIKIEKILLNKRGDSLDQLGSYIVGATLVRDDYEELVEAYPQLAEVAELAADLETLTASPEADDVFRALHREFDRLKLIVSSERD